MAPRDVLVSVGPGISAGAGETQKEQFTESNAVLTVSPSETLLAIKGPWVEASAGCAEACPGSSPHSAGRQWCGCHAVGRGVLLSAACACWDGRCGSRWRTWSCVCLDAGTFQTSLDPDAVVVKKLSSVVLLRVGLQTEKKKKAEE